jgi:hypothetical protein
MQVLDRGGKIEILVEKTDSLRNQVCLPFYILPFFPYTYTQLQELGRAFWCVELGMSLRVHGKGISKQHK